MAWSEGSFLEGAMAGAIAAAGTGAAVGATSGTLLAPGPGTIALGIAGAIIGALLKLRIFVTLLLVGIIYFIAKTGILPAYMIMIIIAVFVFWLISGGKR